jgi:alpha-methylacyl-CoA racemase
MTGWGQDGPLAQDAGHDINYLALSGALHAIGSAGADPVVPLNLVGDMGGGGMLLALGVVSALLSARISGRGQVVDAAMTDGIAVQLALVHGLLAQGRWHDRRGANVFDGAAPFYRAYRCADGRHVAVGCVEPQFYRELLDVVGLAEDPVMVRQRDETAWPAMSDRLGAVFATRTRDEWTEAFAGREACVTPVLDFAEAAVHPHNASRGTYAVSDGAIVPAAAPRFLGTPSPVHVCAPLVGAHTSEVMAEAGLDGATVDDLRARGVLA